MKKGMILGVFLYVFAAFLTLFGCEKAAKSEFEPKPIQISRCESEKMSIKHVGPKGKWERVVELPSRGKFVAECHYVSTSDVHMKKSPISTFDGIALHLENECKIYQSQVGKIDCEKLFKDKWDQCWTPSEGGEIGVGAIGFEWQKKNLKHEQEIWGMNMMWERPPKPGTKFLVCNGDKCVVAYAGHETGPGSQEFLGGISSATQFYLNATNETELSISYLKDQSLDFGPIECLK